MRNVDRIFVLDGQGGIGEVGSHDDLVNVPDGLYNGLMRAQMAIPVDDKGEEGKVVETGAQEGAITSEVVEKDADAAPGGQELLNRVSEKKEEAQVMSRLLSLLFQHPILLTLGLLGGLVFGATFAIWGYLLAKAQTAFYYSTPEKVLEESRFYAYLFVLVGGVALISATLQYYGVCAVSILNYNSMIKITNPSLFIRLVRDWCVICAMIL
ncbi:hypothetical protein EON65_39780 [archaeon]|nr:MAG: hypothetical protein EON65_39780 [archaeon]